MGSCVSSTTLHNLAMRETIATVHLDFIASVGAQLLRALGHLSGDSQSSSHPWLRRRVGTSLMPLPAHQPFSVVAIHTPEGEAVAGRCCLAICAAYFDE